MAGTGYFWKPWRAGEPAPSGAVYGGHDVDGCPIYVGRGRFSGDELPAKVMPHKSVMYVSHRGKELPLISGEILCQPPLEWVPSSDGQVPRRAVPAGRTSWGETLYVGRVYHGGSYCVGKVHPSHGCLYIPFGNKEHSYKFYEILVSNRDD